MGRGQLRHVRLNQIDATLPDILDIRSTALSLRPDMLSVNFQHADYTPIASVCFHDATATLTQVRHALFEFTAHGAFYRERKAPKEMEALFFERYYLEDAAFRLYAFGEHLANAIIFMLNLRDSDLEPHRERRVSQQSTVAEYLRRVRPRDSLTASVRTLGKSAEWQFTIEYRNRLVHKQPPTTKDLGLTYRRRLRWEISSDERRRYLGITLGDIPELDIGSIARNVFAANTAAVRCTAEVLEAYFSILEQHGIRRTPDGLEIDKQL